MDKKRVPEFLGNAACALRLVVFSMLALGGLYTASLWIFANAAVPFSAQGSLLRKADGKVIGSRLIAQNFSRPGYIWPRPSAVDFDAAAAGGSNLPPSDPGLMRRIQERISALGGTAENPVPVELLAASGSGLDPHLSIEAVVYQSNRVAAARGRDPAILRRWIADWIQARKPARSASFVNVLELNIALDEIFGPPPAAAVKRSKEKPE